MITISYSNIDAKYVEDEREKVSVSFGGSPVHISEYVEMVKAFAYVYGWHPETVKEAFDDKIL